jgi:hypothetical protein
MKTNRFLIGSAILALATWGARHLWLRRLQKPVNPTSKSSIRKPPGRRMRKRPQAAKAAAAAAPNSKRGGMKRHE